MNEYISTLGKTLKRGRHPLKIWDAGQKQKTGKREGEKGGRKEEREPTKENQRLVRQMMDEIERTQSTAYPPRLV